LHDGIRPAVEALADAWQAARREAPEKTILVTTKTNAEHARSPGFSATACGGKAWYAGLM
jgi:hypothetical protein